MHGMGNSKVVGVKVPLDRQLRPQGKCTNSPNTTRETPLCSRLRTAESSPWQSPDSRFKYAVAPDASALASPAAWASAETVPCVATTLSMLAQTALMTRPSAVHAVYAASLRHLLLHLCKLERLADGAAILADQHTPGVGVRRCDACEWVSYHGAAIIMGCTR